MKLRRLAITFRALRSRNYRLFFMGQSVSLIGTWMQRIGTSWLVYRLTDSAFYLGLSEFASQFSAFLMMPIAGVYLDRWQLRRALLTTQVMALIHAAILAGLTLTHHINLPLLLSLCVLQGLINAFDMPGRHAFAVQLISRKRDLGNAIALNSTVFNLARLLGPAIGGILIDQLGEGLCFLLNTCSFVPIVIALTVIDATGPGRRKGGDVLDGIREGYAYAWNTSSIRTILAELSLISLAGTPYVVLLPVFAKEIFAGGPSTLGWMMGAVGAGALAGALYMASRRDLHGLERLIPRCFTVFGAVFVVFAWSRLLPLSIVLLVIGGAMMVLGWASSNTLLQAFVDDDKRGRVMSLYMMSFMGTAPIGSLLAGSVAHHLGAPLTLCICGTLCLLGTAALRASLHALGPQIATLPRHATPRSVPAAS